MYDFWDYCNAVRRNVLATTLFIAVVRVNETKFLSNLTLSSFSAGLDFGWGGDVCKRGGWKCMCGCWRFLVVRLCCKPGFRGGPGGNRRAGGGPPPPWKADRDITGPNSCTCTARPLILATQGGTQVAHRYLSRNRHSRTDLNWIDQIRFLNSMAMQQEPIEDGGTDSIYFWPIFQA